VAELYNHILIGLRDGLKSGTLSVMHFCKFPVLEMAGLGRWMKLPTSKRLAGWIST
jgi:hypothetical protein